MVKGGKGRKEGLMKFLGSSDGKDARSEHLGFLKIRVFRFFGNERIWVGFEKGIKERMA